MGKDVIIACDFSSKAQTLEFLDRFGTERPFVKIGMELYYAEGPAIVPGAQSQRAQDLPGPEAARYPQHRQEGHACAGPAGGGHGQSPRRRDEGHDGSGPGGPGHPRQATPAADRRDAADLDERGPDAGGPAHLPQPWTRRSCTTRKTPGTRGWTASSAPRWRLGKFTPPAALAS